MDHPVDYQTAPDRYRHWKLGFDGPVATLVAAFDEDGGIRPGYKLKLNSYDLGVDIELNDALNRIRFEHPEVADRRASPAAATVFSARARTSSCWASRATPWKVNFCKFTNETRNGLEDSSRIQRPEVPRRGQRPCAGGGYELALACDEILLIDDRSSAVSLPEVPLLGVLPGTGGLTRLTDKRHVRHDLADVFCTTSEGVRGQKAVEWRLVDAIAKPAQFADAVRERALKLAAGSDRPREAKGVALTPLERAIEPDALHYTHVSVAIDRAARTATFIVKGPAGEQPAGDRGDRGRRRRLVSAQARARTRGRDPLHAHQRTRYRRLAAPDRGRSGRRARHGRDVAGAQRSLACPRDDRLAAPHLQPPRRHLSQPLRAGRRGLVLRRLPLRTCARLRPHLPARAPRRPRPRAEIAALGGELWRLSDGFRPDPARRPLL